ncbi:MAG: phosphoribosylanthranilate isomerase [Salinisphaeraceae bacterium]|nr:phosphoribosylanthranilate isomerase [Salinisphaeraceae bacterium]
MRTRVKICGLTSAEAVGWAVDSGADAVGFVFHPDSPRFIEPEQARILMRGLPAFVVGVALFMDMTHAQVEQITRIMRPGLLQFHGSESPEFCRQFGLPYIKSVPMGSGVDPLEYAASHHEAAGVLLDSNAIGEAGGSGRSFSVDGLTLPSDMPSILAGGLNPANVADLIQQVRPYAVDVSSGVESAPGVKCRTKIRTFMQAVRDADQRAI